MLRRPHPFLGIPLWLTLAGGLSVSAPRGMAQVVVSPANVPLAACLFDPLRPDGDASSPFQDGGLGMSLGAGESSHSSPDVLATPFLGPSLSVPDGGGAVALTMAGEASLDPWGQAARQPHKVSNKAEGIWGTFTAQVTIQDGETAWEEPLWKRQWKSEEAWRWKMAGPLSFFGQLGANSDEAAQQNMQVAGHTGVACQVPVGSAAEFQVRSGPRLTYTDPLRPDHVREQTDLLVEVQARCPLLFGIGLEYQGTAMPALSPVQRDAINQDLHLAIPVGEAGKVQVGAKHRWQSTPSPQPWSDGMQLYLGLELNR